MPRVALVESSARLAPSCTVRVTYYLLTLLTYFFFLLTSAFVVPSVLNPLPSGFLAQPCVVATISTALLHTQPREGEGAALPC